MVRIVHSWMRPTAPRYIGGAELAYDRLLAKLKTAGFEVFSLGSTRWPWEGLGEGAATDRGGGRSDECGESGVVRRNFETDDERWEATENLCASSERVVLMSSLEGADATLLRAHDSLPHVALIKWVHDCQDGAPQMPVAQYFASEWLAQQHFPKSPDVLIPAVGHEGCMATRSAAHSGRRRVLFVNPIASKGWHLVLACATELPEIDFIVRMGWYDTVDSTEVPSNMFILPRGANAECIYSGIDLTLVPSVTPEGYGLVAAESLAHGIPTLTSGRGALAHITPVQWQIEPDVAEYVRLIRTTISTNARQIALDQARVNKDLCDRSFSRFVQSIAG